MEEYDFPKKDKPSKILIIASTGRCGSHMLGHVLHKTNCFGFPLEYANPANLAEWKKRLGKKNLPDVLTEIQKRRTSPNGIFAIKIHYSHLKQFGGFHQLAKFFPNAYYLHLSRNDILRQAVSLAKAKQTGVWIAGQKPVNNYPTYIFKEIDRCLRQTILDNSSWRYVLAANGCNYIDMKFEMVLNNLIPSIKKIASFMDVFIDPEKIPEEPVTKKQSSDMNSIWAEKFISEYSFSSELVNDQNSGFLKRFKRKIKQIIHE